MKTSDFISYFFILLFCLSIPLVNPKYITLFIIFFWSLYLLFELFYLNLLDNNQNKR